MTHLTLVSGTAVPAMVLKRTPDTDICLLDYAQCPNTDVCILADYGSGCQTQDWCLVDKD